MRDRVDLCLWAALWLMVAAVILKVVALVLFVASCARPVPTAEPEQREMPWCFRWLRTDGEASVVESYCTEHEVVCERVQVVVIEHGGKAGVRAVGSCRRSPPL